MSQVASQSRSQPEQGAKPSVILRVQGVQKAYRMGDETVTILRHIDLTLREGEFVAIEGRSGSGKSTLLHILGGLDAPDVGRLEFDGKDYTPELGGDRRLIRFWLTALVILAVVPACFYKLGIHYVLIVAGIVIAGAIAFLSIIATRSYLRERPTCLLRNTQFGFVFQFYHLLPELNVLENTLLSPMIERSWLHYRASRSRLRERAKLVLSELGLSHRLHHKPNQLSGGERQRVAIARALMNEPRILFADEPTGNLDYETGRQIMSVLEKLHREKSQTIVMVTHDRTLARQADRVLVLVGGKLERVADTATEG
jgi:lipoprotein-releasing system ATP-binding protein